MPIQISERKIIGFVKEGNLSISEAVKLASLGEWEMMDLLIKNDVKSELTLEDLKEEEERKIAEEVI